MNTKLYLKMINDHLNDETTFKMVESNCDAKVMIGIARILEKDKGILTQKENNILQVSHITQAINNGNVRFNIIIPAGRG